MIANQFPLLSYAPIKGMLDTKCVEHGVSYGLGEVGYDIRLKQDIKFYPSLSGSRITCNDADSGMIHKDGSFVIGSAIEEFDMPNDLMGVVHDKSTWARRGLSVFNTVIEPGWKGFLTLELVYHGQEMLHIPAGAGIAQVVFHRVMIPAEYEGKYQHQANCPVEAIMVPS